MHKKVFWGKSWAIGGGVRLHPPFRMERKAGCGRIGAGGIAKTGTFLL